MGLLIKLQIIGEWYPIAKFMDLLGATISVSQLIQVSPRYGTVVMPLKPREKIWYVSRYTIIYNRETIHLKAKFNIIITASHNFDQLYSQYYRRIRS